MKKEFKKITEAYEKEHWATDMIYDFVQAYSRNQMMPRSYVPGTQIYEIDAHTIRYIRYHKGTTVTEIAAYWHKTKATVSAQINRLIKDGYLEKRQDADNAKIQHLYLTAKGQQLDRAHTRYDKKQSDALIRRLMANYSEEDLETFYQILAEYTRYLNELDQNESEKETS